MTGNKLLFGLVITFILLTSVPAPASGEYKLGVFGNANEDDTIDLEDVEYTKLTILGLNDQTQLTDGKHDGKTDILDVTQIELIILEKEKELTIIDGTGDAVTVRKPVGRIIVELIDIGELIRILNAKEKVIGVTNYIRQHEKQFPELSKLPFVGNVYPGEPDYEAILNLNSDIFLVFSTYGIDEKKKNLPEVPVIFLGLYYPELSDPERSGFADGVRKLGYILDREDEAEEYINWRSGWINKIRSGTEGIPENEKPRGLMCSNQQETKTFSSFPRIDTLSQMLHIAGGKNIAEELPEFDHTEWFYLTLDPEWVIAQNPEFIFIQDKRTPYGYDMDNLTRMKEIRDEFMNRPELANVAAVKSGNVYILSSVFRNDVTGGVTGAAYMAKLLHPDIFEDLDPEAIHQEYLTLQHFDYDLNEHGIFFYPPIEIDGDFAGIPNRYKGKI